jgi:hypothetical protein
MAFIFIMGNIGILSAAGYRAVIRDELSSVSISVLNISMSKCIVCFIVSPSLF